MQEQLSLFNELDAEREAIEHKKAEQLRIEMQMHQLESSRPVTCEICGDESPNRYIWEINHGGPHPFWDLPGACIKQHMMWNHAHWAEENLGGKARLWLSERGFALPETRWFKEVA